MSDPFDLERFVDAQDQEGAFASALQELRGGRKRSHWMWFVFPQIAGLGDSEMSRRYAIGSLEEAAEYLRHPVLGPRLLQCTRIMADSVGRPVVQILGEVDAMKLRSSMTLFAHAAAEGAAFRDVLERHFDGAEDPATVALLGQTAGVREAGAG